MNYNSIICFDFETTSVNPHKAEITQIGACVVNPRNLKIIDEFGELQADGTRTGYMVRPLDVDNIEKGALEITGFTLEQLAQAPHPDVVFPKFINWVQSHNHGKNGGTYTAPIPAGYNILGYDMIILNRYCEKYGCYDEKRQQQKLFNSIHKFDLMDHMWAWTENMPDITRLKLSIIMEYMGFTTAEIEEAHGALADSKNTARIMIRLLKLMRKLVNEDENGRCIVTMKDSFKKWPDTNTI